MVLARKIKTAIRLIVPYTPEVTGNPITDIVIAKGHTPVSQWIEGYTRCADYAELNRQPRPRNDTADGKRDDLCAHRYLQPQYCVEIGTFFAQTTRILAEELADNPEGTLVTIDPFGKRRVPVARLAAAQAAIKGKKAKAAAA